MEILKHVCDGAKLLVTSAPASPLCLALPGAGCIMFRLAPSHSMPDVDGGAALEGRSCLWLDLHA